jgi:hypothetical protein
MDDDRRSNVAGAEDGVESSPAPEPREMTGRERELAARTLADRESPEPHPAADDAGEDDVDRRS